ncbi:LD-carboxypeptidase [Candidatus Sumerlaeota bacterium]|nr:LD-carboxypeptidase [Candidatus Sumerlaeota bacterium]
MAIKSPHLLKSGDTIALLAPSSPLKNEEELAGCVKFVEGLGLKVKEYPSVRLREDYLAGSDKQRAKDLNNAFGDKHVQGVFCMRGGYGAQRLLPLIDWKLAAKSRKLLLGFSDITSLIGGLASQSNLASLHGPTPSYFLHGKPGEAESREALRRFIFGELPKKVSYRELCGSAFKPQTIRKGKAKGVLVGGNASVFVCFMGTKYVPKAKSMILFLEEIGEKPYRIDRFVAHMINTGYMKNVGGVVLGDFTDCEPTGGDQRKALEVLADCLTPLKIPVLAGLPIGHARPSYPLMMGKEVTLDATKGDLVS